MPGQSVSSRARKNLAEILRPPSAKKSRFIDYVYRITGLGQVKPIGEEKVIESGWTVLTLADGGMAKEYAFPRAAKRRF
jgi:hypothetical protein